MDKWYQRCGYRQPALSMPAWRTSFSSSRDPRSHTFALRDSQHRSDVAGPSGLVLAGEPLPGRLLGYAESTTRSSGHCSPTPPPRPAPGTATPAPTSPSTTAPARSPARRERTLRPGHRAPSTAGTRSWPSSPPSDCGPCPARDLCTKAKRRTLTLRLRDLAETQAPLRTAENTRSFQADYARRSPRRGHHAPGRQPANKPPGSL